MSEQPERSITSPRRYYLLKRQDAAALGDKGLELLWRGKQEAETGAALPTDFPHLSTLEPLGYVAREDLDGADECELREMGLTQKQAQAVLEAFADL